MIGSLRGVLVDRPVGGEVLLEVGGVGYRVAVSPDTATRLGAGGAGAGAFLWIHHHFRDDHQALYGFVARAERDCFELLLGAHGVGPALALAILSVHPPAELVRILADDDLGALCLVPGVGRKTAARLAVELKSRLLDDTFVAAVDAVVPVLVAAGAAGTNGHGGGPAGNGAEPSPRMLVRQALAELGYGPEEVRRAVAALEEDADLAGADESTLLRAALRRLAR